jgi:WhiB family redox-sensing transcriptional regulator
MEWRKQAACFGYPVYHWFPESKEIEEQILAMQVCSQCPVKEDCLEYSLWHEQDGIWGGMNQTDRQKLRKKRRIRIRVPNGEPRALHANCGTDSGYQSLFRESKRTGQPMKDCDACRKAHALADQVRRERNPETERTRKRLSARKQVAKKRSDPIQVADKSEWLTGGIF